MNKAQLVAAVLQNSPHASRSAAFTRRMLDTILDEIMAAVARGETVSLQGFGTFRPVPRIARQGRNPILNVPVDIPATTLPRFKAGPPFRRLVADGHQE